MKKANIWLGLCLLLALAAFKQDSNAQIAPANDAMLGAGLAEAGEKARQALLDGDYRTLHGMMDAAALGQMALLQEKFSVALDESGLSDEEAKKFAEQDDPRGELGVQGVGGLRNLTETEFFGLISGMLAFKAARPVENAALRWHLVAKGVGMQEPRNKKLRRMAIMNWVGAVAYANRLDETVSLLFSLDGKDWKLAYYDVEGDDIDLDFARTLEHADKWDKDSFKWTGRTRAMMAEGEQLLGSMRDYCRVQYAKTGEEDEVAKFFDVKVKEGNFEGMYYDVQGFHKSLPGSDFDAAVEAHPEDKSLPWALIQFKWASGESKIEWFDTRADLDARVAKLKEEQVKEPK
jgi:hypothetical protein